VSCWTHWQCFSTFWVHDLPTLSTWNDIIGCAQFVFYFLGAQQTRQAFQKDPPPGGQAAVVKQQEHSETSGDRELSTSWLLTESIDTNLSQKKTSKHLRNSGQAKIT